MPPQHDPGFSLSQSSTCCTARGPLVGLPLMAHTASTVSVAENAQQPPHDAWFFTPVMTSGTWGIEATERVYQIKTGYPRICCMVFTGAKTVAAGQTYIYHKGSRTPRQSHSSLTLAMNSGVYVCAHVCKSLPVQAPVPERSPACATIRSCRDAPTLAPSDCASCSCSCWCWCSCSCSFPAPHNSRATTSSVCTTFAIFYGLPYERTRLGSEHAEYKGHAGSNANILPHEGGVVRHAPLVAGVMVILPHEGRVVRRASCATGMVAGVMVLYWIRGVFWLGPPGTKGAGIRWQTHISNPGFGPFSFIIGVPVAPQW